MAVFDINPGGSPQAAGNITFGVEGQTPTFTLDSDGYMTVAGGMVTSAVMADNGNGTAAIGGMETVSRFGNDTLTGTSGRLWVNYCTSAVSGTVTQILCSISGTAGVAITFARMCIFRVNADNSLTLVARTANDPTIGSAAFANDIRNFATAGGYPASFSLVAGQRYALGFLQVAGTPCSLAGKFVSAPESTPIPFKYIDAQAEIAATYADAALTTGFTEQFMRVQP